MREKIPVNSVKIYTPTNIPDAWSYAKRFSSH